MAADGTLDGTHASTLDGTGHAAGQAVVVCTFATPEFAGAAAVLRHTALRDGGADGVVVYDASDVREWFRARPGLDPAARGYGWWSWKPWCILRTLRALAPGDVAVWCDATVAVEAPLAPHVADVRHARLFRQAGWREADRTNGRWTKPDAFVLMERDTAAARAAVQLDAAVQVYRHTPEALAFLEALEAWCGRVDVLDDTHRLRPPGPEFEDHRHDQSVLSLLALDHPAVQVRDHFGGDGVVEHHRRLVRPAKVAVVTGTTGSAALEACVRSVQEQDLPNVEHYLVADGPEHVAAVEAVAAAFRWRQPLHVVRLPHNTGAGGFNAHRIYAAMPWLVAPDTDLVAFLDEDNAMDPDHLRHLVRGVAGAGVRWAHSLRRIVDRDGADVCPDNCESLGGLCHTVLGAGDRLVDTSCYLLRRDLACRVSPVWNLRARDPSGREVDRELAKMLLREPHVCVRRHTLRYRAGGTPTSVKPEFFVRGNARMGCDFAGKPDLYVFLFHPEATARFVACRAATDRSYALDEWQPTLLRGLAGEFNLLDGYACLDHIPPGSAVVCAMWHPEALPLAHLKDRPDLWRVCYTLESPNARHAEQWDPAFLAPHFDVVLTYWKPLLADPRVNTLFCPHNTHHLDLDDPADAAQLRVNRGQGRSCAMVLECRGGRGAYAVPNVPVTLECLEFMREALVSGLRDVTVFGKGWDASPAARLPGVRVGHAGGKEADDRHAVDILQGYVFAVIAENCDAEGYASEKLFDALLAGCIPLYYGSVPPELEVPEGPDEGVYADVRALVGPDPAGAGHRVQAFIDSIDDERLAAWRARVAALRPGILRKVGTAAFADVVRRALDQRPV